MNIDGINTGYVLDHIKAGKGFSVKRIIKALGTSVPFLCYIIMLVIRLLSLEIPGPVLQLADIISGGNAFCAMLMIGVGFKLSADKTQIGKILRILLIALMIKYRDKGSKPLISKEEEEWLKEDWE